MIDKRAATEYDAQTTQRCERILATVLGDIGPWRQYLYLVGGLVPRYLIAELPPGVAPHLGTSDVDLVIALTVETKDDEAYRTLYRNLVDGDFVQDSTSFRWRRDVEGHALLLEFLTDTTAVDRGRTHKVGLGAGKRFGALNVTGAHLVADDYVTRTITAERLDGGGISSVEVRVANLLPYLVLKIQAFQDRHAPKDVYDLVFCVRNWPEGPAAAGRAAGASPILGDATCASALKLLAERFDTIGHDAPVAYRDFLAPTGRDPDELRQEAVAVIREFRSGLRDGAQR